LPLVPVTFTAYEPVAADVGTVTVRTELLVCPALRVTGFGLNEPKGPVGETVAERLTEPVKLFWLVMLIVEVVEEPWVVDRDPGFAERVKSGFAVVPPFMLHVSVNVPPDVEMNWACRVVLVTVYFVYPKVLLFVFVK
jgi:hypothetical protein